jgi:hypothetical protein
MAFKITATDATVFDTNQIDNVAGAFKTALSLDQVTNLSDANLPISTAQQAAFDVATYSSTVNELAARKPSLDFNFAADKSYTRDRTNLNGTLVTSRSGPPLSFYRNSAATFVDSDGLIKYAPENLLLYSESFSAASWQTSDAYINVNATTAPDATSSADKLVETATTAQHLLAQDIGTVVVGSSYTLSVYAKAGERTNIALTAQGESLYAVFNLSAGSVTQGGSAATIAAAGNGWYRCSATFTKTNTNGTFYLLPWTSTNSYAGTASSGVYIWGAQVERGSAVRTYLSTSSAVNTLAENLILYPNTFAGSYWDKTAAVSVTDANAIGPFSVSATDATKLTETTGTTVWRHIHDLTGNFAPIIGQTYTMSIYVKADATWSSNYLQLAFWSAGFGNSAFKNYDITTKTVSTFVQDGATNIIASGIDTLSNGWLRIWVTSTATATGVSGFQLAFVPALTAGRTTVASNAQYTRTSAYQSIYIYGAQVVVGDATVSLAWPGSAAVYGPRFDHDATPLTTANLYGVSATTGENLFSNSSDIAALGSHNLVRSTLTNATGVPTTYNIQTGGLNYMVNDIIGILGGSTPMLLKVLTVNGSGTVLTVEPIPGYSGAGYSTGVQSSVTGSGTGFTLNITAVSTLLKLNADTTASSNHRFDHSTTTLLSRSSVMTVSAYVKAAEYSGFAIGQGNGNVSVAFSLLSNGSVTYSDTANGWSGAVTAPDANGFIRCSATLKSSTYITTSNGRVNFFVGIAGEYSTGSTGNFIYTGAAGGTSGIYIKNIQIESNLRATDYNATSGNAIVGSLLSSNTKRCKGLLVEPQVINYARYSSLRNAVLPTSNVVIAKNITTDTAPDGTTNLVRLRNTPSAGSHTDINTYVSGVLFVGSSQLQNGIKYKITSLGTTNWQNAGAPAGAAVNTIFIATGAVSGNGIASPESSYTQAYCKSFFVKAEPGYPAYIAMEYLGSGSPSAVYKFDIITKTFTGSTPMASGFIDYPNGWIRVWITTYGDKVADRTYVGEYGATATQHSLYIWGLQLEASSSPTSYIPTEAGSTIRAADFAGISGADFTKFYNNSEGTFIIAADATRMGSVGYGDKSILAVGKVGTYEAVSGIIKGNDQNNIYSFVNSGYSYVNPNTFTSAPLANSSAFEAAIALKGGNNGLCFNGALPTIGSVPAVLPSTYDSLRLYDINNQSAGHPTMWVSQLQYYPVRKSNQFMSVTTTL